MQYDAKKITFSELCFFLKTDTSKYKGEWIAIAKNKVIAHGKDAQEVYEIAKKKAPKSDVSLAKTPDEQMLVLTQGYF